MKAISRVLAIALVAVAAGVVAHPAQAANVLGGTNRADTINGSAAADILFGRGGADTIHGNGGNDILFGGGGADHVVGGSVSDTIIDDDSVGTDTIQPGRGTNIIYAADGAKTVIDCQETATGGNSDDIVFADAPAIDTVSHCGHVFRV